MMHTFDYCIKHVGDIGLVQSTREAVVSIDGLSGAVVGEGVSFENGSHGMIVGLRQDACDALVFSREPLKPGIRVARTGHPLSISVGEAVLGRTMNAMGYLESGEYDRSDKSQQRLIDPAPLGISQRVNITKMMETGISVVDTVVPIGRGQRELIIGDRTTGKTHFLLQTLLTQAKQKTIVIYVAIGKRQTEIKRVESFLRFHGVYEQCVLVAASSYDSPGEVYIAPLTGMAIAEYFRDQGKDTLVIFDDLTVHAKYYREFALVLGSFPGRESYPGDIFHLHARLLERAGCFPYHDKDVAITCLPVVDSVAGDMTGYIQTNVMSMTDGHLFFDAELMAQGIRPAVNVFLSVTRVGRQTQSDVLRNIGSSALSAMKAYEDAQRFLRFGPELTDSIQQTITRGKALRKLFTQTTFISLPIDLVCVLVALIWNGQWDGEHAEEIAKAYMKHTKLQSFVSRVVRAAKQLDELARHLQTEKYVETLLEHYAVT